MKKLSLFVCVILLTVGIFSSPHVALADDCTNTPPPDAPNLFQINRTKQSAKLFFSPVPSNDSITGYTISYGFQAGDDRYDISVPYGSSTGVITYTVNNLDPLVAYTFRVRADNGCAPGVWSNYRSDGFHSAKSETATSTTTKGGLLVAGSWEMPAILTGVFAVLAVGGLLLFL